MTRWPQMRLCRTTVRPGLLSTFPTHTEPSETEIFVGLQALYQVARQERRLRSVLHSRHNKRSNPRISQALCTVSCTGIRASSSLMQMFRSAGISFNVVVQKPVPGTSAGTTPHIARIPCTVRCRWRFCRLLLRSPSSPRFLTLRPRTVPPEDATTLSFHSSRRARCENQDARSRSELWLAR